MWSTVVTAVGVAALGLLVVQWFQGRSVSHMPGPARLPFVGHVPYLMNRPWSRLLQFARKYGGVFRVFVWGSPLVFVSEPEALKRVLVTNAKNYVKDPWSYTVFKRLLGNGIVTSTGEAWKAKRALLSPAFHSKELGRYLPVFQAAVDRVATQWRALKPGTTVELDSAFRSLTLEVISEVTLGLSPSRSQVLPRLFVSVMDEMNLRVFAPYRKFFPSNRTFHKTLDELDAMLVNIIRTRRQEAAGGRTQNDILGVLLTANPPLPDNEIRDEMKTMLLAGHETSSMMITWALYLLGRHPAAMAKATACVDALYASTPSPTVAQYKELSYLLWVLKEGMRLYSPVPALTRESIGEDVLGGYRVPPRTKVAVDFWSAHHSKAVWGDDVEEFRPERFSEEESRGRNPFGFLPFGVGKRNCVGQHLALLEGQVVMACLLRQFTIALIPNHPPVESQGMIVPVRPDKGVFVTVAPRTHTA